MTGLLMFSRIFSYKKAAAWWCGLSYWNFLSGVPLWLPGKLYVVRIRSTWQVDIKYRAWSHSADVAFAVTVTKTARLRTMLERSGVVKLCKTQFVLIASGMRRVSIVFSQMSDNCSTSNMM